jgi:predicted transcriptional regulator
MLQFLDTHGADVDDAFQTVLLRPKGIAYASEKSGFMNHTHGEILLALKKALFPLRPSRVATLVASPVLAIGAAALELVNLPVWLFSNDSEMGYDYEKNKRSNPFGVTYGLLRAATETVVFRKVNTRTLFKRLTRTGGLGDFYSLESALKKLDNEGFVVFRDEKALSHVGLTPKGRAFVMAYSYYKDSQDALTAMTPPPSEETTPQPEA